MLWLFSQFVGVELQIKQEEDLSLGKISPSDPSPDAAHLEIELQELEGGSVDYPENLDLYVQNDRPVHNSSASLEPWLQLSQGSSYNIPASSFAGGDCMPFIDHPDESNFDLQLAHGAEKLQSRDGLDAVCMKDADVNLGSYVDLGLNTPEIPECTDSTVCHGTEITDGFDYPYFMPDVTNSDGANFSYTFLNSVPSNLDFVTSNEQNMRGEMVENLSESACSSSLIMLNAYGGGNCGSLMEASMFDMCDVKGQNLECEGSNHVSPVSGNFSLNSDNLLVDNKRLVRPFHHTHSCISSKKQVDEVGSGNSTNGTGDICSVYRDLDLSLSSISPCMPSQNFVVNGKDENYSSLSYHGGELLNSNSLERGFPGTSSEMLLLGLGCIKDKREGKLMNQMSMGLSKVSPESIHSNSSDCRSHLDDDPDVICIPDDNSQPAFSNQPTLLSKVTTLHHSKYGDPLPYPGSSGPNAIDKHIIRFAMEDLSLSQSKSEASPPDGVLAVSLLKHQRIALSWMIQKETSNEHCSGGILADDQGLGKTVSTIALILKERPPPFKACPEVKKVELETVNLDDDDEDDEDDDGATGPEGMKQESDDCKVKLNRCSRGSSLPSEQAKGRPACGTLVVCPTSVLRQWAEELQNKVTSEANLSVLVYHGGNRTKDPSQLAKYDVVLTTYSIVSMEVPKQPSVDEDDDEECYSDGDGFPASVFKSSKKRKYKPTSDKKGVKHQKRGDGVRESVPRPLAKVGWFRVILDEAQSIKNHRTQVARACWGLRAKRRWCLSGTPIQNAVDDLYSYFRFLRYEPFSAYKSFCSKIKIPITKNPRKGYIELRAVLKTIMLRRTKGTFLDGKPIINLPPKVVELKKVDFTKEERDFYSRLEADSRAQFKEYATAGTVKQNYVNILLMLLRLRQACDNPLLVKGFDSNSLWRSSAETAKKLSREERTTLLNCLEASLALCGICNDPPEDAVVAVCGHVFCNQCISEHITGDDNPCPTVNCKVRVNMSTVFSKVTLNSSLSEQSGENSSGSEVVESVDPYFNGQLYQSSKIKAALEVLQSLTKPQDYTSKVTGCSEDQYHLQAGDPQQGSPDKKNVVIDKSLDNPKIPGEKAIVFSQWTRMLDLFEDCLKNSSIQYRRLDGTMSVAARDKAVKDFNTLPEVTVMIMSLKAASLGLNMVAACHVLLLDLWWNPTTEDQAIDRAHRIGQTRPVSVLRLTVKDTVEDRILALQEKKREMVASAFGEDETGGRQTRLTVEDLEYLFSSPAVVGI
ncbi:hypothetical protein SLEP1_g52903 [Rubroshorea leprosula]|uniref:Helicase-like transcription factor CHR28 n=2 Tax=Rubroshorea leprosula TaxID=152421 RepID=A0AAV5M8J9_9ROSI|nr:hypothetical protein SLEP1_g52903 [Rubroshorea leprosula]